MIHQQGDDDQRGETPDMLIAAAREPRTALLVDLIIRANLDDGRHIHLLDRDGDWCLNGQCRTSTNVDGISPPDDEQ